VKWFDKTNAAVAIWVGMLGTGALWITIIVAALLWQALAFLMRGIVGILFLVFIVISLVWFSLGFVKQWQEGEKKKQCREYYTRYGMGAFSTWSECLEYREEIVNA
jgi:hypothetical protein